MKASTLKRLDGFATKVSNIQAACNMSLITTAYGHQGFEVINNKDRVFEVGGDLAVNSQEGSRLSQALQTFVNVAARNDDLNPEVNALAPVVDVTTQNGTFRYYDRSGGVNTMTSIADLERAVMGEVKLIGGHGVEVPGMVRSYGIGFDIDEDACNNNVEDEFQVRTGECMDLIALYRLQRNLAVYTAVAAGTSHVWNSTTNPNSHLRSKITAARTGSGYQPTLCYMDAGAWDLYQGAYENQATAGAFAASGGAQSSLAAKLQLREVIVSKALQRDNSGAFSSIFANKALLFRNGASPTVRSDDFCKTFQRKDQGQVMRVHRRQISTKVWRGAITWSEVVLVTAPLTGDPVRQLNLSDS
jgi:hypothetical protein